MRARHPILIIFTAALMSSTAFAAGGIGADVPVSGSIASPGATTATFTNPAGLVGNRGARLSLQAGSPDPMEDPNYRALALAGNGTFGVSAGVDYQMYDDNRADPADAVYGLALDLSSLNLALGVAGRTGIKNRDGTDFNAGILLRPTQFVTLGATAMGLNDEVDSYGLGLGLSLFSGVDLIADAAFDNELKNGEFKPGLRLSNGYAGLSLSYGTGPTDQFADEFSAAAYLRVGANSELELQYNHGGDIPEYYGALTFGF